MDLLDKIEVLRQKTGASYRQAKEALERADGDVLQALIFLEEDKRKASQEPLCQETWAWVRGAITEGMRRQVVVSREGRVVAKIPLLVGLAGAVLLPHVTALGLAAAWLTKCDIGVQRQERD